MSSGIYKIYCRANDKTYIGQTNDFDRRFKETKTNCAELARKYYLSRFTVWDIIKERTWKE
jgi:predicted GIY-YIG superfamily endonuclease